MTVIRNDFCLRIPATGGLQSFVLYIASVFGKATFPGERVDRISPPTAAGNVWKLTGIEY